jgi:hypothetical protein
MPITTAGRNFLVQAALNDSSPTFFNAANAHLGVGSSSTAFSAAHTDLQAASDKLRKGMMATFPQRADNVATFKSSFGDSEANFAWAEWALFNNSSGGLMLSRKVESLGTKASGTWELTVTLTLTLA